jgi:hypothetical protein
MKSNYIHFHNSVAPLPCHYCHKAVFAGTSRTVLDDKGSLVITAWTCGGCGTVNEQIGILLKSGQVISRPNRYVVAPQHSYTHPMELNTNLRRK